MNAADSFAADFFSLSTSLSCIRAAFYLKNLMKFLLTPSRFLDEANDTGAVGVIPARIGLGFLCESCVQQVFELFNRNQPEFTLTDAL